MANLYNIRWHIRSTVESSYYHSPAETISTEEPGDHSREPSIPPKARNKMNTPFLYCLLKNRLDGTIVMDNAEKNQVCG
eukprot:m.40782 g.40782  ORF g.40782 m.40782 type:complete len:79 (-) comp11747_c0_seq1:442-678(-)